MKSSHMFITALAAAVALSSAVVVAQPQQGARTSPPQRPFTPPAFDPDKMFDNIDTNKDGSISRAEFKASHQRMQARREEFRKRRIEEMEKMKKQ